MNRKSLISLTLGIAFVFSAASQAQPPWPPTSFSAYYGGIDPETPKTLANFDLLIVHPGQDHDNLDASKIAALRSTGKAKTIVGYISIGEDDVSPGGPPLKGRDSQGPSFVGSDLMPGDAHNGYPSYFVDQKKFLFGADGFLQFGLDGKPLVAKGQDGHPDENGVWGSYYVKADNPVWEKKVFEELDHLTSLGLDGFFLDTVDTASPWGDYGWTSPGMLKLVEKIRERYPDKRIVANRGLFYLTKNDRYAKLIDAVLFESLLTEYHEETKSADISPWARWHVQALDDDVIPAQKRTGLTLLVLDYLNPEDPKAPLLVQSARAILRNTPHSLSYSHPALQIPGWDANELLTDPVPVDRPTVTKIELSQESRGQAELVISFDHPVPSGLRPDLRITSRDDVAPERAAQLPLADIDNVSRTDNRLSLTTRGLDQATKYRVFFRLIAADRAAPSPFAWSAFETAPSELAAQVQGLASESRSSGLQLAFAPSPQARSYRVYAITGLEKPVLWNETPASPVLLSQAKIGEATELFVVAVDAQGREGYPSEHHIGVLQDVTAPASPKVVKLEVTATGTTFRWNAVPEAESYRLYTVPEKETFRLPLLTDDTEVTVSNALPGKYRVFLTSVDGSGNQSRPGPSIIWTAP